MQVNVKKSNLFSDEMIRQAIKRIVGRTIEIKVDPEEIIFSFAGSPFLEIGERPVIRIGVVLDHYLGVEEFNFESQQEIDSFVDLLRREVESLVGMNCKAIVSIRSYRLAADYCQY
jgi:hypothetical protein